MKGKITIWNSINDYLFKSINDTEIGFTIRINKIRKISNNETKIDTLANALEYIDIYMDVIFQGNTWNELYVKMIREEKQ